MSENIGKQIEFTDELTIPMTDCDLECSSSKYISENIVNIDKSDISEVRYDKSKFQKGIDKMSKLCGMITALVNVGITPDNALNYISESELNRQGTEATVEITKIQAEANVSSSKYNSENSQRNMI